MTYDPQRHHRRSIRLSGYDYSQEGVIFVTTCTYQREMLFGEVLDGQMVINDIGHIVLVAWQGLPLRFPSLTLDEFVIMPNHVHGILIFGKREETSGAATEGGAATEEGAASSAPMLGQVMRAFKSLTAISANRQLGRTQWPLWQRNYHEHIIRNEQVMEKARRYIAVNPMRWDRDADNPINL